MTTHKINGHEVKPGDYWKTRDGMKAIIYAVHDQDDYPIHGATLNKDEWHAVTWSLSGEEILGEKLPSDLIEPWTEKKNVKLAVFRCRKEFCAYKKGALYAVEECNIDPGSGSDPDPNLWERVPSLDCEVER